MTRFTNIRAEPILPASEEIPVGIYWVLRGILQSESGVDLLLTAKTEPAVGLSDSLRHFAPALAETGLSVERADSDVVVAGMLRAALLAKRRAVAIFGERGFRQAIDALYEASRLRVSARSGSIIILCAHRWRQVAPIGGGQEHYGEYGLNSTTGAGDNTADAGSVDTWTSINRAGYLADPRELAIYLGLPILAPSTPAEACRFVNEGLRLSRASGALTVIHLTPALLGSGESELSAADPTERSILRFADDRGEESGAGIQIEARRRQIDRLINAPLPGERAPAGFITFGAAHAALRHALNMLGLTGRLPILKLGHINPADDRLISQFLTRCERVAVVEAGSPIVQREVERIAHDMLRRGLAPAQTGGAGAIPFYGDTQPSSLSAGNEIHPSDLVLTLGPFLQNCRPNPGSLKVEHHLDIFRQRALPGHAVTWTPPRGSGTIRSIPRLLLEEALASLKEAWSLPTAARPAIQLIVESIDSTTFEIESNQAHVILMERHHLNHLGRAAIAHSVQRRHRVTYIVMEPTPAASSDMSSADADRLARSAIPERHAGVAGVSSLDPADVSEFEPALGRAILAPGTSVVILNHSRARSATERASLIASGPTGAISTSSTSNRHVEEIVLRPFTTTPVLCHSWLARHGFDQLKSLDGFQAPRLEYPDITDPSVPALDHWDGFIELKLHYADAIIPKTVPSSDPNSSSVIIPEPVPVHRNESIWRVHLCGRNEHAVEDAGRLIQIAGRLMSYRIQVLRRQSIAGLAIQIVFSRPRPDEPPQPITPQTPYGCADLVIATDLEALLWSVAASGGLRVASPDVTSLVLNLSPTLSQADDLDNEYRRHVVPGEVNSVIRPHQRLALRAGELCQRAFRTDHSLGAFMIGLSFQKGLIPVSSHAMHNAASSQVSDPLRYGLRALEYGRAVVEAGAQGELPPLAIDRKNRNPVNAVRRHVKHMSERWRWKAGARAREFETLALGALDSITGLRRGDPDRTAESRFISRMIDCETVGGVSAAACYAELIARVYAGERSSGNYPLTRLVIEELGRAQIVPDLTSIAALLVRGDRIRHAGRDFGLNRHRGDQMEIRIRGRIASAWLRPLLGDHWSLGPATLSIIAQLDLPGRLHWWGHREQREYAGWTMALTNQCIRELPDRTSLWLEIFRQLTRVRGFGIRRQARIRRVRLAVQSLLELARPEIDAPPVTGNSGPVPVHVNS